jgi:hypothetical protein
MGVSDYFGHNAVDIGANQVALIVIKDINDFIVAAHNLPKRIIVAAD